MFTFYNLLFKCQLVYLLVAFWAKQSLFFCALSTPCSHIWKRIEVTHIVKTIRVVTFCALWWRVQGAHGRQCDANFVWLRLRKRTLRWTRIIWSLTQYACVLSRCQFTFTHCDTRAVLSMTLIINDTIITQDYISILVSLLVDDCH